MKQRAIQKRPGKTRAIAGRKTRRIVAPGSTADEERAWRLARSKGALRQLNPKAAVDVMVEDVLENVHVKAFKLLLKVAGIFEKREDKPQHRPKRRRRFLFETAVAELRDSVPCFTIDSEREWKGEKYQIFFQFAEYICVEAEVLQYLTSKREGCRLSDAPRCLRFLERALAEHDIALRYLIVECVHMLARCEWSETIKEWAGPKVRGVWA